MKIQNKNTLIHAMKTGINVFVGAGFSLYAYDKCNEKIPTGRELTNELQKAFNVNLNSATL